MANKLHLDIETYSEEDLKKAGLYRYAEHPSTEILVACYAFDNGPVLTWVPHEHPSVPNDLRAHIEAGGEVRAHNAQFERRVLNGSAGRRVSFPRLKIEQMVCTAAKCAASGLPRSLAEASKVLGTHPKAETGINDMRACSKPRRGAEQRFTPGNDPERFQRLYAYCADDVRAERDLDNHLPDLSPNEQGVWELDQRINDNGIAVDLPSIANVQFLIEEYKKQLAKRCQVLTGVKPTQREMIASWVRGHGYPEIMDLQADTVNRSVRDPRCPEKVKQALRIYSTYGMKAVSKYEAIERAVCADGRLHGMFLYYGAGTGRWASMIVQLQNLYRGVIADPDTAIDAFAQRDLEWVRFLYPGVDPMKIFASCIRGVLVAPPGKDLLSLDYSGVESRSLAWLFDETQKLDAYRAFDAGKGPGIYELVAASLLQKPVEDITRYERQSLGKTPDLAFGYEGGVNALVTMAGTYGVDLNNLTEVVWHLIMPDIMERSDWMWGKFGSRSGLEKRVYLACNSLKEIWRAGHPKTVQGWRDMKDAAISAVLKPGEACAIPNGKIIFKVEDDFLKMRLPSGRRLSYFKPEIEGEDRDQKLTYLGIDTATRRWMRTGTYGGKLTENAVQAISRDLMVHGVRSLESEGYMPIATVHDEGVFEVDEGFGSLEGAIEVFTRTQPWAAGLPVAAEGYRAKRYRK